MDPATARGLRVRHDFYGKSGNAVNFVDLIEFLGAWPIAFALLVARVSAFMVASPMFGYGVTPNAIKVGLCVALSSFWMHDYTSLFAHETPTWPLLVVLFFFEVVAGWSTGYFVRLIMLPTRIAGSYIGQEIGFNLGQVSDPTSGEPTNEAGLLMDALGLVIFWTTDVHHTALRVLAKATYLTAENPAFLIDAHGVAGELLNLCHEYGLMIVAPIATILFVTLIVLLMLMRAWPQTTLFTFGLPMRLLIGLTAFFVFSPVVVTNISLVYAELATALESTVIP